MVLPQIELRAEVLVRILAQIALSRYLPQFLTGSSDPHCDGQRPWLPLSLLPPSAPGDDCRVPAVSKPCSSTSPTRLARGSSPPAQDRHSHRPRPRGHHSLGQFYSRHVFS